MSQKKSSTAERRQLGLCAKCDDPAKPGRTKCQRHIDIAKRKAKVRVSKLIAAGLCRVCAKSAAKGKTMCETHLEKLRGHPRQRKNTRRQPVKPGFCAFGCGSRVKDGRRLCDNHLKQERDKIRAYRASRKEQGLCWRCPKPAREGGILCEDHRQQVRLAEQVLREQRA
jgi:hypothetical protein